MWLPSSKFKLINYHRSQQKCTRGSFVICGQQKSSALMSSVK